MLFTTPESPCPRPPGGPKMLSRQPTTLDLDELQLRIRTASATQLPALAPSPSAAAQPGFNSISQPAPVPSPPPKAMAQCGSCPNMAHVGGGSPPSGGSPLNASSMLLGNKNAQWKPQMKPALSETHSSLPPPTPQPQQREAQETSPVPEKKKSGVNLGRISQMFKGALKGSFFQSSTNSSSNNTATQGFSKLSGQFARNSTKSNRSVDLEDEAGPCDVPPSRAEAASPPPITVVATKLPPDTVKDSVKDSASSPLPKQSSSPQVHLSSALPETPAAPTPIAVPPPTPFATVQSPLGTPPASEQPHSQHSQGVAKTHLMSQKSMEYAAAAEAEARLARRAASISKYVGTPSMLLVVTRDLPARMLRPVWSLRDYTVLEKMYTGYASNVYKAKCKYSGVLVCLKSYTLGALCELNRYQIFREVRVHSSLSHENIIKLYGAFQQGDQVVLVQEYANSGDLFTLLHKYGGRLPERNAVEVVLQPFLSVINYLHANGIVHRDIKPENILFTSDMRLKLCDFGLAINMREERAVTRVGTLEYMAPEVLDCPFKNKPEENKGNRMLQYSYHVDTWAVGVLTYELLVGLPPFNDKQRNAVEEKIRAAPPRFPSKMSEQCRDFITMALEKNPLERPTVVEMLNHSWMRMHKRSNSVQQLSTLERQQSLGSPGHGASRCPSQNLGLIQEEEPANGVPPPQLPSTQAVLCSPTHSPAPPKAKPLPIAANKAASAQPRHLAGGKGAYDVDVLSSSYTSGALPLTAFPGMVNAAAGKTTAPNPSLFVPVLDKHIAQQEQAVQAAQAAHAAQQRQAAQQEQAAQVAQAAQAAQAAHVTQQRLRPLQQSSRPNSFDAGAAVAPVADTNTLSPLAPRHAPFLPSSCSPRAASLADAAPGMHAHSLGSPPKASSLTKALRSLA